MMEKPNPASSSAKVSVTMPETDLGLGSSKPESGKSGGVGNSSTTMAAHPPAAQQHQLAPLASAAPKPSVLRFPVRIGLTWKKGERLEAQDFSNTWYPSKIVEINEELKEVLIHFEGWNQRYDEWFEMTSEKLRPCTRHSERKDKGITKRRRVHPHPIYRPGDEVLAKWKDCKRYPAKISRLMEESTYEVIFYDGVTHLIQAINIQPLPESMKAEKTKQVPPPLKAKSSFKQVKLNLPASFRKKQEQKQEKSKMLAKQKRSPPKVLGKPKLFPKVKVTLKRDRELDVFSVTGNKGPPTPNKKPKEPAPVTITCEATLSTLSEAECLKLFGSAAVAGSDFPTSSSNVEGDTAVSSGSSGGAKVSGVVQGEGSVSFRDGVAFVSGSPGSVAGGKKLLGSRVKKRANTDTSVGVGAQPSKAKKKKRVSSSSEHDVSREAKPLKRPQVPPIGSGERSKSLDLPPGLGAPSAFAPLLPPQVFIPSKAFIVEEDHNPFKCPYDGCTKDFRKENLLQYHIKYYHSEPETSAPPSAATASTPQQSGTLGGSTVPTGSLHNPNVSAAAGGVSAGKPKADGVGGTVGSPLLSVSASTPGQAPGSTKRRRRKTDSVCSTDSEMSASSKSKSSKRQRNDSEISVTTESPEAAGRELQTDSSRLVQELKAEEEEMLAWPDTEEADEEEMASDMVNCICGQRHHTGLMIQCEVCLCWQHFKCTDVKKTGVPPANYVCRICEQTPGVRDSSKFLHDLSWERRGELPTFPFKQPGAVGSNAGSSGSGSSSTANLTTLSSECNDLLATLQGIKRALHSTRRQIKISKEEDDPEFQLWQTDWDNWTKPEDDLTLTPPRSVEPDLSPTPSTFLFPPASQQRGTKTEVKKEEEECGESRSESASTSAATSANNTAGYPSIPTSAIASELHTSSSALSKPSSSTSSTYVPMSSTAASVFPSCAPTPSEFVSEPDVTASLSSQLFAVSSTPPKSQAGAAPETSLCTETATNMPTSSVTGAELDKTVPESQASVGEAAGGVQGAGSAAESHSGTSSLGEQLTTVANQSEPSANEAATTAKAALDSHPPLIDAAKSAQNSQASLDPTTHGYEGSATEPVTDPQTTTALTARDTAEPSAHSEPSRVETDRTPAAIREAAGKNSPLTVNTSQAAPHNTKAPSPSISPSSTLSSLQTPPMMLSPVPGSANLPPPQTPSVSRASSVLPSIRDQSDAGSLVKDLFAGQGPGPAGDATFTKLDLEKSVTPLLSSASTTPLEVSRLHSADETEKPSDPQQTIVSTSASGSPSSNPILTSVANSGDPELQQARIDTDAKGIGHLKSSLESDMPRHGNDTLETVNSATDPSTLCSNMQEKSDGITAPAMVGEETSSSKVLSDKAEVGDACQNSLPTASAMSCSKNSDLPTHTGPSESLPTSQGEEKKDPAQENTEPSSLLTQSAKASDGTNGAGLTNDTEAVTRGTLPLPPSPLRDGDGNHHHHHVNGDAKHLNGNLSPGHVSSLYVDAAGVPGRRGSLFNDDEDEDTQDNDTDTAEESADPYKNCEHNLLVHVRKVHSDVESQLEGLEARILELENSEHNNPTIQLSEDNILNDVPALKKSLSKLARYLSKVQHFSS